MSTEKTKNIDFLSIIKRIKEHKNFDHDWEVANLLGYTKEAFSERKRRKSVPIDRLEIFCERESINIDWVFYGEGPKHREERKEVTGSEVSHVPQPDEYVYLPLYNLRGAAGHGAVNDTEQIADVLAFKAEWVKTVLMANKSDLFLMYVDGESMEPTLRPGDIILIDKRDMPVRGDGIYVFRMDGALLIKRLQRLPGGIIKVTSDNAMYEPFEIRSEQLVSASEVDKVTIIGRVVWAGRRF